ncbi:MAG: diadenylate cyclase CdaA [Paludibacteraceae bacterium]
MELAFGVKDVIDIVLVALLLFEAYRLMKEMGAGNIFVGIMAFVVVWFLVTHVFKMELLGAIFNKVVAVGAIGLIVIFQSEIRRFFSRIGSRKNWKSMQWLKKQFRFASHETKNAEFPIMRVVLACRDMSRTKTGALIVLQREDGLQQYIESGEIINADISTRLIENVFFKNSPLHDGAMIIADNRVKAAGAILPVSQNPDVPQYLGLRHRSALGITERTDALVIIVSEETGTISLAKDGKFSLNITAEQLEHILATEME